MRPILAAAVVLVAGCDMTKFTINSSAKLLERASPSAAMEDDLDLARAAMPGQIRQLEGLLYVDPGNRRLQLIAARAYCEYSFAFLEDDLERLELAAEYEAADRLAVRIGKLYKRCFDYGLKILGPAWKKDYETDQEKFLMRVAKAKKGDIPGLYWTARGLGGRINMDKNDMDLLVQLPVVRAMLERIVALDETFQNGGAHLALGFLNSAMGESMGGNPKQGKMHFERVIELTKGRLLLPKVFMAKAYARITGDRELFHKLLTEVLETPHDIWPEMRLANEVAFVRAERYLAQEEEWF